MALADGLLSLGGSIFGNALGAIFQASTNRSNMKLAKYQNDWNYKIWKEANAYNTPAKQVERLQEAGINPVTAFGGMPNTASGVAKGSNVPTLHAYTGYGDLGASSALAAYRQSGLQQAEIAYKDALTSLTKSQKDVADGNAIKSKADAAISLKRAGVADQEIAYLLEQQKLSNESQMLQNQQLQQVISRYNESIDAEIAQKSSNTVLNGARVVSEGVLQAFHSAQIGTEYTKQANLAADTRNKYAQISVINNQAQLLGRQIVTEIERAGKISEDKLFTIVQRQINLWRQSYIDEHGVDPVIQTQLQNSDSQFLNVILNALSIGLKKRR